MSSDPTAGPMAGSMRGASARGMTDDLVAAVLAVPGVAALEPGITSTLRTLDARVRRRTDAVARYGLHLDEAEGRVIVEVAVCTDDPLREVIEELQEQVIEVFRRSGREAPEVLVRVQSV